MSRSNGDEPTQASQPRTGADPIEIPTPSRKAVIANLRRLARASPRAKGRSNPKLMLPKEEGDPHGDETNDAGRV